MMRCVDGKEEFGPMFNADSEMVLLTEVTSYSGKAGDKREALPNSGFNPRGRRRYGSAVPVVAPKPVEGGGEGGELYMPVCTGR